MATVELTEEEFDTEGALQALEEAKFPATVVN